MIQRVTICITYPANWFKKTAFGHRLIVLLDLFDLFLSMKKKLKQNNSLKRCEAMTYISHHTKYLCAFRFYLFYLLKNWDILKYLYNGISYKHIIWAPKLKKTYFMLYVCCSYEYVAFVHTACGLSFIVLALLSLLHCFNVHIWPRRIPLYWESRWPVKVSSAHSSLEQKQKYQEICKRAKINLFSKCELYLSLQLRVWMWQHMVLTTA